MAAGEKSEKNIEELKSLVVHTLETNGVLGQIRAQLRANVYKAIDEDETRPPAVQRPTPGAAAKLMQSPVGPLMAEIVAEFFEFYEFRHSLSVFVPESNLQRHRRSRTEVALDAGIGRLLADVSILEQLVGLATSSSEHRKGGLDDWHSSASSTTASSPPPSAAPTERKAAVHPPAAADSSVSAVARSNHETSSRGLDRNSKKASKNSGREREESAAHQRNSPVSAAGASDCSSNGSALEEASFDGGSRAMSRESFEETPVDMSAQSLRSLPRSPKPKSPDSQNASPIGSHPASPVESLQSGDRSLPPKDSPVGIGSAPARSFDGDPMSASASPSASAQSPLGLHSVHSETAPEEAVPHREESVSFDADEISGSGSLDLTLGHGADEAPSPSRGGSEASKRLPASFEGGSRTLSSQEDEDSIEEDVDTFENNSHSGYESSEAASGGF